MSSLNSLKVVLVFTNLVKFWGSYWTLLLLKLIIAILIYLSISLISSFFSKPTISGNSGLLPYLHLKNSQIC